MPGTDEEQQVTRSSKTLFFVSLAVIVIGLLFATGCSQEVPVIGETKELEAYESSEEISIGPECMSFIDRDEGWGGTFWSPYDGTESTPIFHYYNNEWHPIKVKGNIQVSDVEALDSNNVWVIGIESLGHSDQEDANSRGIIAYFDGEKWRKNDWPTDSYPRAISMASTDDGWVVGGEGEIFHYDGKRWTIETNYSGWINDCDAPVIGECLFVGDKILHFKDGEWTSNNTNGGLMLNSISMSSRDTGWAVGTNGMILSYHHKKWWHSQTPANEMLQCVDMAGPESGWAVGLEGGVYKYDGFNWEEYDVYHGVEFYSVAAISSNEAWVAGEDDGMESTVFRIAQD